MIGEEKKDETVMKEEKKGKVKGEAGVIVKEDMEEARVQESFSLEDGVMLSRVTGSGTNQANNNQLGDFVLVKRKGTGQSLVARTTVAGSWCDNPLPAIEKGESLGISFSQVSFMDEPKVHEVTKHILLVW